MLHLFVFVLSVRAGLNNGAFEDCSRLKEFIVDAENATYSSRGNILYDRAQTKIIYVPRTIEGTLILPDTLTEIGTGVFDGCSGLIGALKIPDNVTKIGDSAFSGCGGLTELIIGQNVKKIGFYAFYGCTGLMGELRIPDSVTFIDSGAFQDCTGLTSVKIGNGLTEIGSQAFNGCNMLEKIIVDGKNTAFSAQDGILYDKAQTQILLVPRMIAGDLILPEALIEISDNAFSLRSELTSVVIGNHVEIIGNEAFSYCIGLTSVVIGDNVEIIGYQAFSHCHGLTNVVIGDSVTTIGSRAFENCIELAEITFGKNVTTLEWGAFANCNNLTKIHFKGTMDEWKTMEGKWMEDWDSFLYDYTVECNNGTLGRDGSEIFPQDP